MFQSLSRDSGRLNVTVAALLGHASIAFQSLSRDSGRLNLLLAAALAARHCGFNPSVGIRGV